MKFFIKQIIKIIVQGIILPIVYFFYKNKPVNKNLVIFADAHYGKLPYSMKILHRKIKEQGFEVMDFFDDYSKMNFVNVAKSMCRFMKYYAVANTVIICDYYLPVASCNKRKETKVIQLWHGCGNFKKFGYDTPDDIPKGYFLKAVKNYNLVTVSAKECEKNFATAFNIDENNVKALGISRTDEFFDEQYIKNCKDEFYKEYPDCKNKKIVLWAPTFRGKASNPVLEGKDAVLKLQQQLGDEWKVLVRLHPHFKENDINCKINTEKLLPVVDLLISDYSSVIFEFSLFMKPIVKFVPDFNTYFNKRGFYIDYEKDIVGAMVIDEKDLFKTVVEEYETFNIDNMKLFKNRFMKMCDGKATDRIIDYILAI